MHVIRILLGLKLFQCENLGYDESSNNISHQLCRANFITGGSGRRPLKTIENGPTFVVAAVAVVSIVVLIVVK